MRFNDLNTKLIILFLIVIIFSAYYFPKKYKARSLFFMCLIFFTFFIYINNREISESFTNSSKCNNLYNWSIGPYSDLTLKPYQSISDQFPLVDHNKIKVYQANIPLNDNPQTKQDVYKNDYPTVDGTDNTLKDNFMFAYNQSSPLCCPSTYSTSSGCVCLTDKQKAFIANRGTTYNK
jgi:hypothetical protein